MDSFYSSKNLCVNRYESFAIGSLKDRRVNLDIKTVLVVKGSRQALKFSFVMFKNSFLRKI